MKRFDLPLLLASGTFDPKEGDPYPLDRVRMQKAVFLLMRRGPTEWREFYLFEPHNWGPYSKELRRDLHALDREGLLYEEIRPWRRNGAFRATSRGAERVDAVIQDLEAEERKLLGAVRRFVTTRNFNLLLRDIYQRYPEYATKSQWKY